MMPSSTFEMAATIAEDPRIVFGFHRMTVNAPSRMSPMASGRSGMMPGLGAADLPYGPPLYGPPP
jgi:hypothetical protein